MGPPAERLSDRSYSLLVNSLRGGGAERQLLELFRTGWFERLYIVENVVEYDIPRDDVEPFDRSTSPSRLRVAHGALRGLAHFGARFDRRHVLVSFLERSNVLNVCSSFFSRHRCIVSIRVDPGLYSSGVYRWLLGRFYRRADLVVVNSRALAGSVLETLGVARERVVVVPNAFDVDRLRARALEPGPVSVPRDDRKTIVCVGRLTRQKNFEFALRLMPALKARARLLVLGDGPLRSGLEALAHELGLDVEGERPDVSFLGFHTNPYPLIREADLLCLPSLYEGLPNVVIEALILGTPVLAADCPSGPREILHPAESDTTLDLPHETPVGVLMPRLLSGSGEAAALRSWEGHARDLLESRPPAAAFEGFFRPYERARVLERWREVLS